MRIAFRRWWSRSAAALLLASLLGAAIFYSLFGLAHRDRVTVSHLAKLKLGMSESEVKRILGEESTRIPCANESRWQQAAPSWFAEEWKGKCNEIRILFDSDGRLRDWTLSATGRFEWTDRVLNWMDWMGL